MISCLILSSKDLKNFNCPVNQIFSMVREVFIENVDKMETKGGGKILGPTSLQIVVTPNMCPALYSLDSRLEASRCASTCPRAYHWFPLTSRVKDQPLRAGSGGSWLWYGGHYTSVFFFSQPLCWDFQTFVSLSSFSSLLSSLFCSLSVLHFLFSPLLANSLLPFICF